MTSREGKPEDRRYRSADVNRKPDSESTYKETRQRQRDFSRTPRHRHRVTKPSQSFNGALYRVPFSHYLFGSPPPVPTNAAS
jgi:hypothetical protein